MLYESDSNTNMAATKPRTKQPYKYVASKVEPDGSLTAQCCSAHCTLHGALQPLLKFAPATGRKTDPRRHAFLHALVDYWIGIARGDSEMMRDARSRLEEHRNGICDTCAARASTSHRPRLQACRDNWSNIRSNMGECVKCGAPATEANHLPGVKKTADISNYSIWASLGPDGPALQRAEYEQGCEDLCRDCHRLDERSKTSWRCVNPDDMPRGNSAGTKEEKKAYMSRYSATWRYPKQRFVDLVKVEWERTVFTKRRIVSHLPTSADEINVRQVDLDHFDAMGKLAKRFEKIPFDGFGRLKKKRMCIADWVNLTGHDFSLEAIGDAHLIPALLGTRPVATSTHQSWHTNGGAPLPTLEEAEAYETRMQECIDRVKAKHYPNGFKNHCPEGRYSVQGMRGGKMRTQNLEWKQLKKPKYS